MISYRVEAVEWTGPSDLQDLLNEWSDEGWTVISVVPTRANTSVKSLIAASASADTTEFAVVLFRQDE